MNSEEEKRDYWDSRSFKGQVITAKAPFTLRTAPYVHLRQCPATYGTVRKHRILQMLNYMLLIIVFNGHNCVELGSICASCCVRRRTTTQRVWTPPWKSTCSITTSPYSAVRRRAVLYVVWAGFIASQGEKNTK